jgi:hypothetical protein
LADPAKNYVQLRRDISLLNDFAMNFTDKQTFAMSTEGRWYNMVKEGVQKDANALLDTIKSIPGHEDAAKAQELARQADLDYYNYLDHPIVKKIAAENPGAIAKTIYKPGNDFEIMRANDVFGKDFVEKKIKPRLTSDILKPQLADPSKPEAPILTGQMIRQRVSDWGETAERIWQKQDLEQMLGVADVIDGRIKAGEEIYKNPLFSKLLKDGGIPPQSVVDAIVEKQGTGNVNLLRTRAGQGAVDKVAQGFLPNLIPVDDAGNFDAQAARKVFDDYGERAITNLYGQDATRDIKKLIEGGELIESGPRAPTTPTSRIIVGAKRTAIAFSGGGTAYFLIHAPVATLAAAGGLVMSARAAGKLFYSPIFRKYLIEGLTAPAWSKEASGVAFKLMAATINYYKDEDDRAKADAEQGVSPW